MNRSSVMLAFSLTLVGYPTFGQSTNPRSADYLFAATADDARALWLNPAGLAVMPEASVFAEFVLTSEPDSNMRLGQLSFGFNSQGLSFGYKRDRLTTGTSNHTYRIGLARGLRNWSIGLGISYYNSGADDRGFDIGVRYKLLAPLDLGFVIRNIGRPIVRTDTLPISGVASLGLTVIRGTLTLAGEAIAQERIAVSGWDMVYRAGAVLSVGRSVPVAGLITTHFDSHFDVTVLSLGLSVGNHRRGILLTSLVPNRPTTSFESLSVTGLAKNQLLGRQR